MNPVRPLGYYIHVLKSKKDGKLYFETCLNPMRKNFLNRVNKNDTYRREKYLKTEMGKRYLRNRLRGGLTG